MTFFDITQQFPNKAGKLKSLLMVQKRLIEQVLKTKPNEDVKKLLLVSANINDVCDDFLNFTHEALNEVGKDFKSYQEGAKNRAIIEEQSEHLKYYFNELRRKD